MMSKTTFDNLPTMMDQIYKELMELKSIVQKKIKQPAEVPKHLDLDDALLFLAQQGYKISKSAMYKKTSDRAIPFTRFNGKLVFKSTELITWCENQINKR